MSASASRGIGARSEPSVNDFRPGVEPDEGRRGGVG
jgi:hypothetical protein